MNNALKTIGQFVLDTIETIVVGLSIFVMVYLFLFQPTEVNGKSMEPTFQTGDRIYIEKVSYRFSNPERGDIVVFKAPPTHDDLEFVKRIIAIPGDKLEIKDGDIYVNDNKIEETYLYKDTDTFPMTFVLANNPLIIPEDKYFVMGDNRNHSSDSREWGLVDRSEIVGRAIFRWWPVNNMGVVK